jgi:flavodoxin
MNTLILYDSQFGNTGQIADRIADSLRAFGVARAVRVELAQPPEIRGAELLILGCPTQGWRPSPAMQSFLEHVSSDSLRGLAVACFDTRFQMPRLLTGSAAQVMAKKIREKGVSLLVPPESYFVKGKQGPLRGGELDRAAAWARQLHRQMEAPHPAGQPQRKEA